MQPMATAAVQARDEGSGVFGFVTALVTLYFTAAMMTQFNEALAVYVGPSMAVIIGTITHAVAYGTVASRSRAPARRRPARRGARAPPT